MRNLLKLKLRAVLRTKFLFRHVLRYFQVFVKKKCGVFWAHPNIYYNLNFSFEDGLRLGYIYIFLKIIMDYYFASRIV